MLDGWINGISGQHLSINSCMSVWTLCDIVCSANKGTQPTRAMHTRLSRACAMMQGAVHVCVQNNHAIKTKQLIEQQS